MKTKSINTPGFGNWRCFRFFFEKKKIFLHVLIVGLADRGTLMDFVFMLTRNDVTVENALDLFEIARPLGLKHIGFKDVGADAALLKRLTDAIRLAGASVWMEVVSTAREDELRSVALARAVRRQLADGRGARRRGPAHPALGRRRAICRSRAGLRATRPGSADRRRRGCRRIAGLSRKKAAPASTSSPIAPPRPSRSTSSPPAGADLPARARSWSQGRSIRPTASPPSAPPARRFTIGARRSIAPRAGRGAARGAAAGRC